MTENGSSIGARDVEHKNRIQSAGSNILAAVNATEKYLGDTGFEALWAELNLREAVVFVDTCPANPWLAWCTAGHFGEESRIGGHSTTQRGVRFDVSVVAEGISLGFDQIAVVYLIYRDITERKNAERKLERS